MSDFHARNDTLPDPRRTYRLTPDQVRELGAITAHREVDPGGHRDRVNTWWAARAAEYGFRWTTISALAVGQIGDEMAEVTFTAEHEPAGDAHPFAPVGADAIVLLAEARNLFREYEAHHRERATPNHPRWGGYTGLNDTIAKAYRNAAIAARIEAFLADPASSTLAHEDPETYTVTSVSTGTITIGDTIDLVVPEGWYCEPPREMELGDLYAPGVFHRARPRTEIEARMTGRASDVPDRFYRSPPAEGLECRNHPQSRHDGGHNP